MYELQTYETILQRMLDRVPNNIDKREGSIVYDALSPAAMELAQMYTELDTALSLSFADTSSGEYLAMRTAEMGITRLPATKARRQGLFVGSGDAPIDVPIGSRFSIHDVNYIVVERVTAGEYILECEVPGVIGNQSFGEMIPIDYVAGLTKAELGDVLIPGEDEETDEKLLTRYLLRVRHPATSGNLYHYLQWALEVPGVGDAKIFPLWNGPGTVKAVIVNTEKQPATPELVTATAGHIETVRPIGAVVTVVSAMAKAIDVSATVTLATGATLQQVNDAFAAALEAHLKATAFMATYVSHAKVGTLLLGTDGVLDYTGLLLNGAAANVPLEQEEIPVIGTVELEV